MNRTILAGAAMVFALAATPSLVAAQGHAAHGAAAATQGADSSKSHAMPCAMMTARHGADSTAHAAHAAQAGNAAHAGSAAHAAHGAQAADTTMKPAMKAGMAEPGKPHDCAACCKAHAQQKPAAAAPGHKH